MSQHNKAWWAVYRLLNKNRLRTYSNNYYHNQNGKEKARAWYHANLIVNRERGRIRNNENRKRLIFLLGDKCSSCAFSNWRALQIDHINGGGSHERRGYGHSASALRNRVLEDLQHPQEKRRYQLLCANCNWIKRIENKEMFLDKRIKQ